MLSSVGIINKYNHKAFEQFFRYPKYFTLINKNINYLYRIQSS